MHNKKSAFRMIAVTLLLIICLIIFIIIRSVSSHHSDSYYSDLQRMRSESYEGIFLSMYSPEVFHEEDFSTFRGLTIIKCENTAKSLHDVADYLDTAFSDNRGITNIYLGLDPLALWKHSNKQLRHWNRDLNQYLLPYVEAHPEVSFEILYPAPSMQYWLAQTDETRTLWMTTCKSLVSTLNGYSNVTMYFPGATHWLINNPGNYLDDLHYNDAVAQKLIMFTFCDGAMVITPGNADTLESMLNDMVAEEKEASTVYPDLTDLSVVFFGDSVIGNYTGSFSIPGVVNGFSGAHVYNCAQGGATASKDPATDDPAAAMSFVIAVDTFLKQDPTVLREDTVYRTSLEAYLNDDHRGRRLCFVINYGLNDYFSGYAVDDPEDPYDTVTYCGALRTGIRSLQEAYPDALILLAAPNYITFFENGTELHGEAGSTLAAYVQGAADVADQMGVPFYDTYHRLGVTADNAADYLADAVHLNEEGRFLFGTALIATLDHSR